MPTKSDDTKELEAMVNGIGTELAVELNEHFAGLDGKKGRDEFSACVLFFCLGRLYERKVNAKTNP